MKFHTVFLLTSVAFSFASAAYSQDNIRFATESSFAPWSFTNANGKLDGFEIDLTHELCSQIKANCQIYSQSWDGIIPSLTTGKYDAIIAAMSITPKRQAVIGFSTPYAVAVNTFMTVNGGGLDSLAGNSKTLPLDADKAQADEVIAALNNQLEGKIVGVQTSTTASAFLAERFKGVEVREYKTMDEASLDLSAGRIDAILANVTVLQAAIKTGQTEGAHLTGPLFSGKAFGEIAIGLRKDDPALKTRLDAGLKALSADGRLKALSEKWFGFDISPHSGQ
ncbi:MAG: transporter substrate-binding domain-containing protein [Gibbsiella quercinecans]|uniref:transporter substrate-binding domain-containing protein n=1 Tax=Gibbsiella quercinecans TaxID=929813 RepID=UPI003F3F04B8